MNNGAIDEVQPKINGTDPVHNFHSLKCMKLELSEARLLRRICYIRSILVLSR